VAGSIGQSLLEASVQANLKLIILIYFHKYK
jgi:hypothetical protein